MKEYAYPGALIPIGLLDRSTADDGTIQLLALTPLICNETQRKSAVCSLLLPTIAPTTRTTSTGSGRIDSTDRRTFLCQTHLGGIEGAAVLCSNEGARQQRGEEKWREHGWSGGCYGRTEAVDPRLRTWKRREVCGWSWLLN